MKKVLTFCAIIFVAMTLNAQVFNTATTLSKGKINLGLNPALYLNSGNNEFGFYFRGGYGLGRGMDINASLGFMEGNMYIGGDFELLLLAGKPSISLTGGFHHYVDPALDITFNLSFPVSTQADLYLGMDMDVYFNDGNSMPVWLFVGAEIGIRRGITIPIELGIGANDSAPTIISGGVNFYF